MWTEPICVYEFYRQLECVDPNGVVGTFQSVCENSLTPTRDPCTYSTDDHVWIGFELRPHGDTKSDIIAFVPGIVAVPV